MVDEQKGGAHRGDGSRDDRPLRDAPSAVVVRTGDGVLLPDLDGGVLVERSRKPANGDTAPQHHPREPDRERTPADDVDPGRNPDTENPRRRRNIREPQEAEYIASAETEIAEALLIQVRQPAGYLNCVRNA